MYSGLREVYCQVDCGPSGVYGQDGPPQSKSCTYITSSRLQNAATCMQVCVDCGATKTPLWRCNVDGVKSLCNR